MRAQNSVRVLRMAEIDGKYFEVPAFVQRSVCGWQVRVTRSETRHIADSHYGGPLQSLRAASELAAQMHQALARAQGRPSIGPGEEVASAPARTK